MTPIPMHTGRFRAVHDFDKDGGERNFIPVRTSLGLPRFIKGAKEWPYASHLAPYGLRDIEDLDEFSKRYALRLDGLGRDHIEKQLREIWEGQDSASWIPGNQTAKLPLVLLCFEDIRGKLCHRTLFATWWANQTGELLGECNTADDLREL